MNLSGGTYDEITANKTYITFPEPQNLVEITCGEYVLIASWQDIFDALDKALYPIQWKDEAQDG